MASQQGPVKGVTATVIAGPVGASFSVYEENWKCPCGQQNYARRTKCFQCRAGRPGGVKPKSEDAVAVPEHAWREALDPITKQIYYFNQDTKETQWMRPEIMGPAPSGTGWYGRGAAGNDAQTKYAALNKIYLSRPARVQSDVKPRDKGRLEGANEYNIWYDKYTGDHWDQGVGKEPAEHRCDPERDSGYTKADTVSSKERCYFCIHFARGNCCRGVECTFYHRIPTAEDDGVLDMLRDIFGRERHNQHRDDMGGVGSFTVDSRTIYIGGIKKVTGFDPYTAISEQFGAFGEVEHINVIHRKCIAFVRYRFRANAEFARVAMANQSLGNSEILNIRWAYDDPNPVTKKAIERANQDAIIAAMVAKGVKLTPTGYEYPTDYSGPHLPEPTALPSDESEALAMVAYGGVDGTTGAAATAAVAAGGGYTDADPTYTQYLAAFAGIGDGTGGGAASWYPPTYSYGYAAPAPAMSAPAGASYAAPAATSSADTGLAASEADGPSGLKRAKTEA